MCRWGSLFTAHEQCLKSTRCMTTLPEKTAPDFLGRHSRRSKSWLNTEKTSSAKQTYLHLGSRRAVTCAYIPRYMVRHSSWPSISQGPVTPKVSQDTERASVDSKCRNRTAPWVDATPNSFILRIASLFFAKLQGARIRFNRSANSLRTLRMREGTLCWTRVYTHWMM